MCAAATQGTPVRAVLHYTAQTFRHFRSAAWSSSITPTRLSGLQLWNYTRRAGCRWDCCRQQGLLKPSRSRFGSRTSVGYVRPSPARTRPVTGSRGRALTYASSVAADCHRISSRPELVGTHLAVSAALRRRRSAKILCSTSPPTASAGEGALINIRSVLFAVACGVVMSPVSASAHLQPRHNAHSGDLRRSCAHRVCALSVAGFAERWQFGGATSFRKGVN